MGYGYQIWCWSCLLRMKEVRLHFPFPLYLQQSLSLSPIFPGSDFPDGFTRLDGVWPCVLFHPSSRVHRVSEETKSQVLGTHQPTHHRPGVNSYAKHRWGIDLWFQDSSRGAENFLRKANQIVGVPLASLLWSHLPPLPIVIVVFFCFG